MLKKGRDPALTARAVEVPFAGRWLYHGYLELDRDEIGRPTFASMREVLDEYAIAGREERLRWRSFWRSMYARERAVVKKIEAARKSKKPGDQPGEEAGE